MTVFCDMYRILSSDLCFALVVNTNSYVNLCCIEIVCGLHNLGVVCNITV